jgi:hypothetical protein
MEGYVINCVTEHSSRQYYVLYVKRKGEYFLLRAKVREQINLYRH